MISNFTVLAIIPARGGSKRIPKKNIKPLYGKPLIAWAIDAAKQSQYIDRIIVSTDSEEIAGVARSLGGEVPFLRPSEFAADNSTDFDVFKHALQWCDQNEQYRPDIVVQLRPTSPLRSTADIDAAIALLAKDAEADSVRTVTQPEQSPYKMYRIGDNGYLAPLLTIPGSPESFNLPGQALPPCYKHVGYVDVMWRRTIIEKQRMTGDRILPLVIDGAVSGIDDPADWEMYEYLFARRNK